MNNKTYQFSCPPDAPAKLVEVSFDGAVPVELKVDGRVFGVTSKTIPLSGYVGSPFFINSTGAWLNGDIPPIVKWKLSLNGSPVETTEGFTYAYYPYSAGTYVLLQELIDPLKGTSVVQSWSITINNRPGILQTYTPMTEADFLLAVEKAKLGEWIILNVPITLNKPIRLRANLVAKGTGRITYNGPQRESPDHYPYSIITLEQGATARNIQLTNATTDRTNRENTANLFKCVGQNAIVSCFAEGIRNFVNLDNKPTNILIDKNNVPETYDYFVWMSGIGINIYRNVCGNSRAEHIVRGNGYSGVTIWANTFTNLDKRPEDPKDIAKGGIVCQWGEDIYVADNVVSGGGIGFGPLGRENGKEKPQDRVRHAVARNNTTLKGAKLEIWHGTDGFLVDGHKGDLHFENTEAGYPPTRTIKNGYVRGVAGTIDTCKGENVTIIK